MKIKKLIIENFMAIREAEIELDDRGLILIQGDNQDEPSAISNGAGKSSIVDSLMWSLYGVTAREETGDAVVNNKVGKNCRVVVQLEDSGVNYTVSRHRKHKDGKNRLYLFREGSDITKGTDKLTQVEINKIVGCSDEVFRSSIYAAQEAMPDLPGMTDRFLKQLVEEAAGVDRLSEAYKIARNRANAQKAIVSDLESDVTHREAAIAEGKTRIETIQTSSGEWAAKREILSIDADQKILEVQVAFRDATKLAMESNKSKIEKSLEVVKEKINAVSGEQDKLRQIQAKLSGLKVNVTHQERDLETKTDAVRALANQIKSLNAQVGQACDSCGKPYEEHDMAEVKSRMMEKLDAAKTAYQESKGKFEDFTEALKKLSAASKKFIESMTDLTSERATESSLLAKLSTAIELENKAQQAKEGIQAAKKAKLEIDAEENPYLKMLDEAKAHVIAKQAELEAKSALLVEERKKLVSLSLAVKVFSPAGVRSHILDAVTPFLNERTAHYLGILSDGSISAIWSTIDTTKKGEAKDKFNISVINSNGAHSFRGLSGGEKRKVRLSTAMALQDLVASRATKPIDLFIGDEIDGALDEAGLERLMAMLEAKAREKGTVLVVSHKEMKSWFRQFITVTKKDGGSTVEVGY